MSEKSQQEAIREKIKKFKIRTTMIRITDEPYPIKTFVIIESHNKNSIFLDTNFKIKIGGDDYSIIFANSLKSSKNEEYESFLLDNFGTEACEAADLLANEIINKEIRKKIDKLDRLFFHKCKKIIKELCKCLSVPLDEVEMKKEFIENIVTCHEFSKQMIF